MIYYESEYFTIKFFPELELSFTTYHGFVPSKELRKFLQIFLELISTEKVSKNLVDNRNMKVIRPIDQEYIQNEWFPEFLKISKIEKGATVESTDVFNKISTESIISKIEGLIPFERRIFENLEEACEWLEVDKKILTE